MENNNLLTLQVDAVSYLFAYIIDNSDEFTTFANLLSVWANTQPRLRIKYVMENLKWDVLFEFHRHPVEVTREQFSEFIDFGVQNNVTQAMFYNSCQQLFAKDQVEHYLGVLETLSGTYFSAYVSYLVFRAIYRPFELEETAERMRQVLHGNHLRERIVRVLNLLQDFYGFKYERDYLLPIYKFCPNVEDLNPIYKLDGGPFEEELWYSLCCKTVEGKYKEEGEKWGKTLSEMHIWRTTCSYCSLQIIIYKVLLGGVHG